MQNFQQQSLKRSQSTTKNIHNLRPSILLRSNSQSSVPQTKKLNNFIQSTGKSIPKPSPAKVSFTYNQFPSETTNHIEEEKKLSSSQDRQGSYKKERKTFLNVISKQSVPQQIIQFVYGSNQPNIFQTIDPTSTQPTSIQTLNAFRLNLFNDSIQQTQRKQQIDENRSSIIDKSLIESFPSSKVKKSKNTSPFKTAEDKVQLPENFSIQIKNEINYLTQNVQTQSAKHSRFSNINLCSNQLQNQVTTRQQNTQRGISQRESFNDTIKINSFCKKQDQKYTVTNNQSTANQSFQPFSTSQTDGKGNQKNQTKKISQFLLCDQQIVLPETNINKKQEFYQVQRLQEQQSQTILKRDLKEQSLLGRIYIKEDADCDLNNKAISQVPTFEIRLQDLRDFPAQGLQKGTNQIPALKRSDQIPALKRSEQVNDKRTKPFGKKQQKLKQCEKLGENLSVLGINIEDLAKTIQRFPLKKEPCNESEERAPKYMNKVERTVQCSVERTGQKTKFKNSLMSQQQTVQIGINTQRNAKSKAQIQLQYQQKQTQKHTLDNHIDSKDDPYVNEFIPSQQKQALISNEQPVFKTEVNKHIEKTSSKTQTMMGSLEIVQTYNHAISSSNGLEHFYSIPQNYLQLSQETQQFIQNQQQAEKNQKYPESLFPQHSHLQTMINNKKLNQKKVTFTKNSLIASPNQQPKANPIFQKSYQKRTSFNGNTKMSTLSNNGSPQRRKTNLKNFQYSSKTQMIQLSSNKKSSQNQNQSAKRQLNYELYKTFRSKSVSKHYTKIAIDESKSKVIQLPLMQSPVQIEGSKIIYPKYIKNKVYYVKG